MDRWYVDSDFPQAVQGKSPTVSDPNSTLDLQLLVARMVYEKRIDTDHPVVNKIMELALLLADTVLMMDRHLSGGGKLPTDWKKKRRPQSKALDIVRKVG